MTEYANYRRFLLTLLCLGITVNSVPASADTGAASGVPGVAVESAEKGTIPPKDVFMLVNGEPITYWDYNSLLISLLKDRFYHGKVPEGKEEETRKEVTDKLVERVLLIEDAKRRGLKPDEAAIQRVIASAEARGKLEGAERDRLLSQIRDVEGKISLVTQLENMVRNVPQPTPAEVRAYFDSHMELFTEPEKLRLSVILLNVDPSSTGNEWSKALVEAQGIYDQVKAGANFAELARKRSDDKSAANGGDLGYLHRGMLPKGLDDKVDNFQPGVVVEPIRMLEGYSIFRLEDRIVPKKMEFEEVKQRAEALLMRDRQDQAWKENLDRLRSTAKIEVMVQPDSEGGKH